MKLNALDRAIALSDDDLLARLETLAMEERTTTSDLVAHLAALYDRASLYAAQGFGSLFAYCTGALRLSEDAACNRIEAVRACRAFPVILEDLASGALTLTSVRLLRPHLTGENHVAVLEQARGRSCREVEVLIAHLAPKPDAPALVRRLPIPGPGATPPPSLSVPHHPALAVSAPHPNPQTASPAVSLPLPPRPTIKPTAPERYRVQFTIGEKTHERLRRLQALLRREIPDGDPGAIFDRALVLLLAEVERRKLGATRRPSREPIRRETDSHTSEPTHVAPAPAGIEFDIRTPPLPTRVVPRAVKRGAWRATMVDALSSPRPASGARRRHSWSSTTSSRTRKVVRPPSATSRCDADATTSTRRNWTSDRGRGRGTR